jgi:hydroxymethylbilane synthase
MLTIGSRGSQLALWQARWIKGRLEELGESCHIEIIKTTGDKITDVPLAQVGGKGLFTKEIEEALLRGDVDLAVHSMKDLPTILPEGLAITAVPLREDPRDALVGCKLHDLAEGSKVGTSSLRRAAQLRALRPDLKVEPVRGNLDTRLRKLEEGKYSAIVLAAAGLNRMGWDDRIAEILSTNYMCPAVGQGALAIETREDLGPAAQLCARLDHAETRTAVSAERALLAALGGGCQVPIGAYGTLAGDELHLTAVVCTPDGNRLLRRNASGPANAAEPLGRELADALLEAGADEILEDVYGES